MDSNGLARALGKTLSANTRKGGPATTGNKKLDRLATALWVGEQGKDWYEKLHTRYKEKTTWTVTVEETDTAYEVVQRWLLDTLPQTKQKSINATTRTVYFDASGEETKDSSRFNGLFEDVGETPRGGKMSETRVVVSLNETREQKIEVSGHKIRIRVAPLQVEDEGNGRPRRSHSAARNGKILFYCRSIAAQDAVIELLNSLVGGRHKPKPSLWVADGWGNWRQQDAPIRKLSSVVLADGVKEDILGDLQKFLDDEKRYSELGIPWHRGYLLHGKPGTGKSSLIKGVAAELGLDLWYLPLGDLKEDSSLVDLVRSVRSRGILLLEDVDAYAAARDREGDGDAGTGITTSALLNALDGVVTPHGLITIMTTNHLKRLDPALVRSGRADRTIKLDLPGWDEVEALWSLFFRDELELGEEPAHFAASGVSQASVSEVFKRHWDYPDKARAELMEMFDGYAHSTVS